MASPKKKSAVKKSSFGDKDIMKIVDTMVSNEITIDEKGGWMSRNAYSFLNSGKRIFGLTSKGVHRLVFELSHSLPELFSFEDIDLKINEDARIGAKGIGVTCLARIRNTKNGMVGTGYVFESYIDNPKAHQKAVTKAVRNAYLSVIPSEFAHKLIETTFKNQLKSGEEVTVQSGDEDEPEIKIGVLEKNVLDRHEMIDDILKIKGIDERKKRLTNYAKTLIRTERHSSKEQWFIDLLFRVNTELMKLGAEQVGIE